MEELHGTYSSVACCSTSPQPSVSRKSVSLKSNFSHITLLILGTITEQDKARSRLGNGKELCLELSSLVGIERRAEQYSQYCA